MHQRLRHMLRTVVAVMLLIIIPCEAQADFEQLYCDGQGNVGGGELYYANSQTGEGVCKYQGIYHVFSQVVCSYVEILNVIMGKVYCGIQYAYKKTLGIVLSIYVAVFGAQLLMGTAQLNARDIVIRLLKVAVVWAFATESAWGVGVAFNFFMAAIADASSWVVNPLRTATMMGDSATSDIIPFMPSGDVTPLFGFLDTLIYNALIGPSGSADKKVLGFFIAMMTVYPTLFSMGLWWVWSTLVVLTKTVMSLLMAISAISFLIAISPVFFSLMLFQATIHFFENWVRHLISYAMQMVLVFGIIVMWVIVMFQFVGFFNQLSNMIFPYNTVAVSGAPFTPVNTWAICPPTYGFNEFGPWAKCAKGNFDATANADDYKSLIVPSKIINEQKFLYYLIYHMTALLIVSFAFTMLLQKSGEIAKSLAGPAHTFDPLKGWGKNLFAKPAGSKIPDMLKPSNAVTNMHKNAGSMVSGGAASIPP
jgi:type IV secretion system protein VirB6